MDKKSLLVIFGLMIGIGALAVAAGSIAPMKPLTTSSSESPASKVKLFFVELSDKGGEGTKIGCGDTMASADVTVNSDSPTVKEALTALLGIKDKEYGEGKLYNALSQSSLVVDSANVNNGVAKVELSGQPLLGGVCDSPRVKAQLEETAKQFPGVNSVQIFINGKDLDTVLSGKG